MVELKHMASYPAEANVLQVDDFDALAVVTDRITDAICNSKFQILSQAIKRYSIFCGRESSKTSYGKGIDGDEIIVSASAK